MNAESLKDVIKQGWSRIMSDNLQPCAVGAAPRRDNWCASKSLSFQDYPSFNELAIGRMPEGRSASQCCRYLKSDHGINFKHTG